MRTGKRPIAGWCFALVTLAAAAPCVAQPPDAYPLKPIRFIVPFAPGGGTDVLARIVAPRMSERLGRQVVVENRAGAGGNLGTEFVAKAAPDGYTILLAYIGPISVAPSIDPKPGFDPVRDFRGVSLMATIPLVLVVHPSMPADSVQKLVALARSQPGKLTYGSAGGGTAQQLAGELFKLLTGTKIVGVPYRGGAPASLAVLTGEVDLLFTGALGVFPHVKAGRLRALAVTTAKRLASAPHLPTVAEAGVKGFEVVSWNGILVPAGTPSAIVEKLHGTVTGVLKSPEIEERLRMQGLEVPASTPGYFEQFIKDETAKWAKVVRAAGIKAD
ncbi:MAG: tripartite tricarboxylate transporter substrate binding protein [Burkholderiales bacterium]|nr:tripartite tricarboxylate transporter substrate binding protein [Burkholderiales bacterium]